MGVETRDDRIVTAPPIARRFTGRPLAHLARWLERQGDLRVTTIGSRGQSNGPDQPGSRPYTESFDLEKETK